MSFLLPLAAAMGFSVSSEASRLPDVEQKLITPANARTVPPIRHSEPLHEGPPRIKTPMTILLKRPPHLGNSCVAQNDEPDKPPHTDL